MVQPKGWDGVKPYWWCDNEHTSALVDHLWTNLIHHPENGIYIKGTRPSIYNSIEINSMHNLNITNINIRVDDIDVREGLAQALRLVMEDAFINNKHYTLRSEEHIKQSNILNLQYIWQPKDKK